MAGTSDIQRWVVCAGVLCASLPARGQHHHHRRPAATAQADDNDPEVTEARRHFEQGRALFDAHNYDAALPEFERSYALLGTRPLRYLLLLNLAQCHERLFRYDEALRFYQRYLDEGGPDAHDRVGVTATMQALDGLLATIRVATNADGAEVWVDDRRIGTAPGTLRIPGGRHVVELRAGGYLPLREEIQLAAHAAQELTFTLEIVRRRRGISPAYFGVAVGLAAASGVVGGVFGVRALQARSDVDARLSDPLARFTVTGQDQQDIRRLSTTADIFYAGAALFGVTATVLVFLTDWRRGGTERRAWILPTPTASGQSTGLGISGAF